MIRGHGIVAASINGIDNSYYYHQDEQGSTVFITDENADIKNSYHYDAFGKILESQEELPNRITYMGQQYDALTQQYYLRARYYNPIIGRFTQYAYCSNNPVSYYDPSGYAQEALPPCKAPAVTDADGGDAKGFREPELKLIKEYTNNNVFHKSVSFNAGEDGTGITYKVFQRNDIDWNMIRTTGAKKGRGLTNAEAAERYGIAPILDFNGNIGTLHHSQQHSIRPLFEAPTRYHNISNAKRAPLHPYKGKLNSFNPMREEVRKKFQKEDSIEYWKTRGRDAMKGAK
ncbi:MAG: RHS repeat-associated core domain-containing protein [Cellulosilyticaceae bacterium]